MSFCSKCLGKYLAFDPQFWLHCHWFWIFSALPVTDITDHCIFELSVSWGALSGGQWSQSLSLSLSFLSVFTRLSEREIQPSRPAKSLLSPFLIARYPLKRQLFLFLSSPWKWIALLIHPPLTILKKRENERDGLNCVCLWSFFFVFFFNQSPSPRSRSVAVRGPLPI